MAPFTHIPIEILYNITEHLDVISIVRLACVSSYFHHNIGTSRSFWARYCRILLEDELLPPSCFHIENFEVTALIKLATRRERVARVTHASQWPDPLPAQRTQLYLQDDSKLAIRQQSIRITPGGRWLMALGWSKIDRTGHILCWDFGRQNDNDLTIHSPVASSRIELPLNTSNGPELSTPWYDPGSQRYYCFVTLSTRGNREVATKILGVTMECLDHRPPSFDFTNEVMTLPYQARATLSRSGRWVMAPRASSESSSIIWDSQSGSTATYSLDPWTPKTFHTLIVTHGGTIFQVRGEVNEDHLTVRFFKESTSSTPSVDPLGELQIPSKGSGQSWLTNACSYNVTPHGPIRLNEGQKCTRIQLKCTTVDHDFSGSAALSENGELYELPLLHEPWRMNEHVVPIWITHPGFHFTLTESPTSRQSVSITADHQELFLFVVPHQIYSSGEDLGRGLLAVPILPSDVGVHTDEWACNGIAHDGDSEPEFKEKILLKCRKNPDMTD
ncbi:hypothetical protein DL93DRAFT_2154574 [Clavulina sp. PMI_390]|nr:hypothetical protein DL93DRAFT_2154574 [Clavulina sp. PMI_390]